MSSREGAVRSAVHKFDGFEVREEWDVVERIAATLEACGYMDLLELVFDAAAENGHIHFADDCPRSRSRAKHIRQAKNVSDRRAGQLAEELAELKLVLAAAGQAITDAAAEREVLAAIVLGLAHSEPLVHASDDFYDEDICGLCDERADHGQPIIHRESCLYERARAWAWLQGQETK